MFCYSVGLEKLQKWSKGIVATGLCLFGTLFMFALQAQTADSKATVETRNLLKNLRLLAGKKVIFGHQDDLAYGVTWKYEHGRSDIKDVTGEYPALFGWDIAGLENDSPVNIDSIPFTKMKEFIRSVYDMGAVNTISWHLDNPVNGKTAWDTTSSSIPQILPGGQKNGIFNRWLDKVAAFMNSLKGSDGKSIPILFRPFHELTGSWFWWGKNESTPEGFKQLWCYTVNYLKVKKNVHNLIYVYNTAGFSTSGEFLERYPGDGYADILSFDAYQYGNLAGGEAFVKEVREKLKIVNAVASTHKKLIAFAETGYEAVPDSLWWTNVLWRAIENFPVSYVMVWRNAGYIPSAKNYHYYAPYKGHLSAPDFIRFYKMDKVMFEKDIRDQKIYTQPGR